MYFLITGVLFTAIGVYQGLQVHAHLCRRCGTVWTHNGFHFGESKSHTCPTCGGFEWDALRSDAWHVGSDGKPHLAHVHEVTMPPTAPPSRPAPAAPPAAPPPAKAPPS